jgi:hypothetical protein
MPGPTKKAKEKATKQKPTLEALQGEIRILAAEIHKTRIMSNRPGDELSDWLEAEKEVKEKYGL